MSADLRTSHRRSVEVVVDYESDHNFYTGFSSNISAGGLFLASNTPQPVGTLIEVRVSLPGREQPIIAKTTVRWVRDLDAINHYPAGMGLKFEDLDPEDAKLIESFTERRSGLFHPDDD